MSMRHLPAIWRQGDRGQPWRHLRGARKLKRKRYGRTTAGPLAGKRMITTRPAASSDGPGWDWEIDHRPRLGKPASSRRSSARAAWCASGRSRGSRPGDPAPHGGDPSHEPHPIHTITADNGCEFHSYKQLEQPSTHGLLCHAPSRLGGATNEKQRLARQYLPKRTCLRELTQSQCSHRGALNHAPGYASASAADEFTTACRSHPGLGCPCGKLLAPVSGATQGLSHRQRNSSNAAIASLLSHSNLKLFSEARNAGTRRRVRHST